MTTAEPMDQMQSGASADAAAQSEWDAIAEERASGTPAAESTMGQPQAQRPASAAQTDPMKELREKIEKLEARTRNAEGHIGGLNHNQRLLQDSFQSAAKAARTQVSAAPSRAEVNEAVQDPAEWATLKKSYPEWAAATEKLLDTKLARANSPAADPQAIARMVQKQVAGQSARVRSEIIHTTLDAVYPDWQNDVKSDKFSKWMDGQAHEVKVLAASQSVRDAARMLALYEKAKEANPGAQLAAQRKQKLANAVAGPRGVRVPPSKAEADMSRAELWELELRKREKGRG